MRLKLTIIAVAGSACIACGDEDSGEHADGDEHAKESVEFEGCEHLAEGPSTAITAGDLETTTPPAVTNDHERFDLTLVAGEGGNVGRVEFASDGAGEQSFFLDAMVPLLVKSADGVEVTPNHLHSSSTECDDIRLWSVFDLTVGTYWIDIGPTEVTEVSLVIEAGHGHAE
jgi:hypothetical protein